MQLFPPLAATLVWLEDIFGSFIDAFVKHNLFFLDYTNIDTSL